MDQPVKQVLTGRLRTKGYSLDEGQIDYIAVLAKKYGRSQSDVLREIVRIGGPLYDIDMTALLDRSAAREAAV